MVNRSEKGQAFLDKADRLVKWLDTWLIELRTYGSKSRREDVERTFFAALAGVGSLHEAILSAATCWNRIEFHQKLQFARENDRLLRWFGKARDAEIHTEIIKWLPGYQATLAYRIVDQDKADAICRHFRDPLHLGHEEAALLRYLFGVKTMAELRRHCASDPNPLPDRVINAGVEVWFAIHGLILAEFTSAERRGRGKPSIVLMPVLEHDNAADMSLYFVTERYKQELRNLRNLGPN